MSERENHDLRLRRCDRIRLREEFGRVYAQRCFAGDDLLTVYIAANESGWSRLGLSVSRKVGTAVRRNLIRRRIREAFRKNRQALPLGLDIVCVVKPGPATSEQDYAERIGQLALRALKRLRSDRTL